MRARVLAVPAPACAPAHPGRFRPGCAFLPPAAVEAARSSSSLGRPATPPKTAHRPQDSLSLPAAGSHSGGVGTCLHLGPIPDPFCRHVPAADSYSGGVGTCGGVPAWQRPQGGGGSIPQSGASPAAVSAARLAGCGDAQPGQRRGRGKLPLQEVHVRQRACAPPPLPSLLDALPRSPPGAHPQPPPLDGAGSGASAMHGRTARACADAQQPPPDRCGSRLAIPITAPRQCRLGSFPLPVCPVPLMPAELRRPRPCGKHRRYSFTIRLLTPTCKPTGHGLNNRPAYQASRAGVAMRGVLTSHGEMLV